jgi:hypothetical protein
VERAFRIFDRDGSGTVSMQEFIDSMQQFAGESKTDEKLVFLFRVYDLDGEFESPARPEDRGDIYGYGKFRENPKMCKHDLMTMHLYIFNQ